MVMATSAPEAAMRAEGSTRSPLLAARARASRDTSYTVTSCPPPASRFAIGRPITPVPTNATRAMVAPRRCTAATILHGRIVLHKLGVAVAAFRGTPSRSREGRDSTAGGDPWLAG